MVIVHIILFWTLTYMKVAFVDVSSFIQTTPNRQAVKAYLVVIVDTVERLIVRISGGPTDTATVCLRVVATLPLSVDADAVSDTIFNTNDK